MSVATTDSDDEHDALFADQKPVLMPPSSSDVSPSTSSSSSSAAAAAAAESPPYRGKLYDDLPITFADISRAEVAIRGGVKRTYCEHSPFISELVGANVYFKGEYKQFTGSFKERGARNAILTLMRQKKQDLRGVIAASAGNHAQALAYHGMLLGVPATVVMPVVAPLAKVDKCRVRFDWLWL
jgi:threonine dehydratase